MGRYAKGTSGSSQRRSSCEVRLEFVLETVETVAATFGIRSHTHTGVIISYRNRVKDDERKGVEREKVPPYRCSRHGGVRDARGRSYCRGSVVGTGRDRDV